MSLVVVALLGLLHRNTVSFHKEESRGGIQSSFRQSPIADVSPIVAALLNLLHRNTVLVSLDWGERTGERVGDSNWRHCTIRPSPLGRRGHVLKSCSPPYFSIHGGAKISLPYLMDSTVKYLQNE
eukprot:scaffold20687_cov90-Skeletonema_dohrnii-CCMP3373.AAC.1